MAIYPVGCYGMVLIDQGYRMLRYDVPSYNYGHNRQSHKVRSETDKVPT